MLVHKMGTLKLLLLENICLIWSTLKFSSPSCLLRALLWYVQAVWTSSTWIYLVVQTWLVGILPMHHRIWRFWRLRSQISIFQGQSFTQIGMAIGDCMMRGFKQMFSGFDLASWIIKSLVIWSYLGKYLLYSGLRSSWQGFCSQVALYV